MDRLQYIDFSQPIYYSPEFNSYIVTDIDIAKKILIDSRFSSNRLQQKFEGRFSDIYVKEEKVVLDFFASWLMYSDGDRHIENRKRISKFLSNTSKNVSIERIIKNNLINPIVEFKEINLSNYSYEITCNIFSSLFSIENKQYKKIFESSKGFVEFMFKKSYSDNDLLDAYYSITSTKKLFSEMLQMSISESEELSDMEIALLLNIIVDGHDPLESSIKSFVMYLSEHMQVTKKEDINKCLSLYAPFTYCARISKEDVVYGNIKILTNERVMCILPRKDRGEESIPFGHGKHRCPGALLVGQTLGFIWDEILTLKKDYLLKCIDIKENKLFGLYSIDNITLKIEKKDWYN